MGIHRPTPRDQLRAIADGKSAVLEELARMQVSTLDRCKLDKETYLLVRLAALVATDAAPVSYRAHLGGAGDPPISSRQVLGTLAAIAPVVGSARVLSAASRLARAGVVFADPGP